MKPETVGQILPLARTGSFPIGGGGSIHADELTQLFEEFSDATSQMQIAHDSLLKQVDSLKDELAQKNQRLERKKRLEALGRVAAGVAHEFRNPLGGMRLTVDALLREKISESDQKRLNHIHAAIRHLDRIVQDLLLFTRPGDLQRSPVRIGELAQSAYALAFPEGRGAQPQCSQAQLIVNGPSTLTALIDPHVFTQILVNLFLNANQAMHPLPGRIGCWWWSDASQIYMEVADEGPGVLPGEEEQIFELFHTRRAGGTGLGLAIVQDRVEAHEGEIAVVRSEDSGAVGWCGARFRITLPLKIC